MQQGGSGMELHPITIAIGIIALIFLVTLVVTGFWCMDPPQNPQWQPIFELLKQKHIC